MSTEKDSNLDKTHLMLARRLHGRAWDLLEKPERTIEENDELIHVAHASLYHWLQVGAPLNQ